MRKVQNKQIEKITKKRENVVKSSTFRPPTENTKMPLNGYKNTKIEHPDGNLIVGWDR